MKSVVSLFSLVAVINLGLAGTAYAEEAGRKYVGDFMCKDVMRASGDDRDIAVAFMHGYLLGKSGKSTFDRSRLSAATDVFIEDCLDHPKSKAIDVLGKAVK